MSNQPHEVVLTTKNTLSLALGIISLVIGVFSLLLGWIPFLGLLAIPISIIGLFLSFIGIVITFFKKLKGVGMPVLGGVICCISLVIPVLSTGGASAIISDGIAGDEKESIFLEKSENNSIDYNDVEISSDKDNVEKELVIEQNLEVNNHVGAERDDDVIKERRLKAKWRMRQDSKNYSRRELREIESIYQVANKNWGTKKAKDSLLNLVNKNYNKANRTGCALLYLGQLSKGKEREYYLKKAISEFSDCFYGDGVQVGAYARYYLGNYYIDIGQKEKAHKIFKEIVEFYPDSIDHSGRFLAYLIDL